MDTNNTNKEEFRVLGEEAAQKTKEIIKAGNARRIVIKNEKDEALIEIPLTIAVYPGYVERVWNLAAISGARFPGIPVEELMFAFGPGFLRSSVYEHVTWRKVVGVQSRQN